MYDVWYWLEILFVHSEFNGKEIAHRGCIPADKVCDMKLGCEENVDFERQGGGVSFSLIC